MDSLYDLYITNVLDTLQRLYYEVLKDKEITTQSVELTRYLILYQQELDELNEDEEDYE